MREWGCVCVVRNISVTPRHLFQGKTTYQLEIPEKKKVPSKYRLVSSKKGFKRYHTDEVVGLRDELLEAEHLRDELVKATSRYNGFAVIEWTC